MFNLYIKYYFILDLVINMLESVKNELKMKSYMELFENNLTFLLWKWHLKYFTFEVIF